MLDIVAIISAKYLFSISVLVGGAYFLLQSRPTQKRMIVLSVVSLAFVLFGIFILHQLYFNPRPFVVGSFTPLVNHVANNGFPSEHATFTALIASVMYVFNRRIGLLLFLISIIVSLGRVYAGVHHFIDIIAGILLAILMTALSQVIINKPIFKQFLK